METPFFTDVAGPIQYEGPNSENPLAYRYYNPTQEVLGKSMRDHMRLAVCYWHSFNWSGFDVFGDGTFDRPWLETSDQKSAALAKMDVAFEFFEKLGVPFFCFHDVDIMPKASTITEHVALMDWTIDQLEERMAQSPVKLLWGTANLFSHPRYAAGAATNPDPEVFACAAVQVRQCLEATHRLGGENYVLWGGREGYDSLLNTDMRRELDQMGRFLSIVVEHKHRLGFKGPILLEPKPHEPTKHQYDHDVATVYGFLQRYGLEKEIRVNIEVNHATLAGHSFEHEIATACAFDLLGSVDINRGDPQNGWDTDQFPNNAADLSLAWLEILRYGGLKSGGFNFDAKLRRQSIDRTDLFHAHIGGIDCLARGLLMAAHILEDGQLDQHKETRYARWQSQEGQNFLKDSTLEDIADKALTEKWEPKPVSGRQEYLENLVSRFQ